jgi:hypothetical protein
LRGSGVFESIVSKMPNLVWIDLSNCNISEINEDFVWPKHLERLFLSYNDFSRPGTFDRLLRTLFGLKRLSLLVLDECMVPELSSSGLWSRLCSAKNVTVYGKLLQDNFLESLLRSDLGSGEMFSATFSID